MLRRSLAALFALWFAFILGEPGMMHACPMHGGGAQQGSAAMAHGYAAMSHGDHSAHHRDSANEKPGDTCTCEGECCATAAVAPVEPAATFVAPLTVRQVAENVLVPRTTAPRAPDLQLPFANGPPHVTNVA